MKRIIALLIAFCICLSLLPAVTASADGNVWDGTVDISWYDPDKSEFYIDTPAKLAGLAALVNGMTDPTCPKVVGDKSLLKSIPVSDFTLVGAGGGNVVDTVYTSDIDFSYKTVYITADMDMGGRYDKATGTWSGPNWTPIGGKFPMLPQETDGDCLTLDTRFNGVLDGQGHTISNLYCYRYAEKGFPYSMAIGIVGYLGGIGGLSESDEIKQLSDDWQPGVRNLVLASGSVTGRRMVGGIVGRIGDTSNGVIIENCGNMASVHSTDAKGVGGIVGSAWGDGVIRGCYNSGAISTTFASPAGGIVGTEGGMDIYCCYNVGSINTNGQSRGRAIGSHDTGVYSVDNCLYLDGSGDDPDNPGFYSGNSKRISISVTEMTASELKSAEALNVLNTDGEIFVKDINGINGGYPVLWYQNEAKSGDCSISLSQNQGGTVSADCGDTAKFGQTVILTGTPNTDYALAYFTVNGKPISSDRFTVTKDSVISAVFKKLSRVSVVIPEDRDFYVAVSCNDKQLKSGDIVSEEDVLTVLLYGYPDAVPEDMEQEYIDAYELTLPGTKKNADGTYTVTGEADINISVTRETKQKAWINNADTEWYDLHPHQSEYTITTPEQLAGLAVLVNLRGINFEGVTVSLGCDISLANTDGTIGQRYWTPIGSNAAKSFSGRFDGHGYSIYNMKVSSSSSYAALFGCCKNAVIENLELYGSVYDTASAGYAAGIAAWFSGGSISGCTSFACVTASGTHAGGIAAIIRDGASIKGCINCGAVTAASGLGGIAGISDSGEDTIEGCANFGSITSTGSGTYGAGGIAGRLAGSISACVNYADVTGTDRFNGGVAGYATTKNHSLIQNSANYGTVSSSNAMLTAAIGGIVGYAQFLQIGNVQSSGTVRADEGFKSENIGNEVGRTGQTAIKEIQSTGEIPKYTKPTEKSLEEASQNGFTVTFEADGVVIDRYTCVEGQKTVSEPKVPDKLGYTGYWAPYTLGTCDITVQAIYRQCLVKGGDTITSDGRYFIAWYSSGDITIAPGVKAELVGTNGGEEGFDGLHIIVSENASVTLENVTLNGEDTMLSFLGNNSLTLTGTNIITSRAEAENNPAFKAGTITVDGEGSLFVTAGLHNPAIYIEPDSRVTLTGGTVSVEKDTLLGTEGGAFYASGSDIVIDGGSLRGHTATDNVAAISADSITITAGQLLAQAEGCPKAIQAQVNAAGGTVYVYGHTGNYTTDDMAYVGAEACTGYSGSVKPQAPLPFTDVSVGSSWYDAVRWCYENGIFNGVSDTAFEPDSSMTRGMFVTVLYRMAGQPKVKRTKAFTDLTRDWYLDAVSWAVQQGITKGTSETTFSPDKPVSRQEAAVFIYRLALALGDLEKLTSKSVETEHGELADWAETECLWAVDRGLFAGTRKALASPEADAPRSMLASTLYTYYNLVQ